MKSILDNWVALQQIWDESLDGNLEPEFKGTVIGVKSQMNTFNYFYGVTILQLVLRHSDNLSKILQQAEVLEITQPSFPRKRKRPAKLLNENEAPL